MAIMNAIFSVSHFTSSVISCHSRFPAQISPPDLLPACFNGHRKFVQAVTVMPLSTRSVGNRVYASVNSADATSPSYPPMVLIDKDADPEATIVQLIFGDRLGALIDTMKALKDLGLDVIKGTVTTEGSVKLTKFFITKQDTGRKVEDPDSLEQIRLTIINNLLKYHPECSEQLAMGETFGIKAPQKKIDVDIATQIHVKDDGPERRYQFHKRKCDTAKKIDDMFNAKYDMDNVVKMLTFSAPSIKIFWLRPGVVMRKKSYRESFSGRGFAEPSPSSHEKMTCPN